MSHHQPGPTTLYYGPNRLGGSATDLLQLHMRCEYLDLTERSRTTTLIIALKFAYNEFFLNIIYVNTIGIYSVLRIKTG